MKKISRRTLLAVAAAGIVAEPVEAGQQTDPSASISASDLAVVDKVLGREYSDSERAMMARTFGRTRANLKAMREFEVDERTEPAFEFDPRLPSTRVPRGKSILRPTRGEPIAYAGPPESLAFATVAELSRLLEARKISSTELTRMYLERLKKFGPQLHCVVTVTEELALKQAAAADRSKRRSPLHGIPWGAKDLLATQGIRTTFGARPFESQLLDYDATVVQRLEAAGAVLVAKLSMGELAMGDTWFGGLTRNPWKPTTGSSGSSAGPGAATAAGLVGFSMGTETLGSIVSPSVVNGVTGLRPTFGRVSRYGAMALCWTMDKIGPMCRGVEDCALVLHAICGPDGHDRTVADVPFAWNPSGSLSDLRIGIDTAAFEQLARNKNRAPIYEAVKETLKKLGVELKSITLPKTNPAYQALTATIIGVESSASFQKLTMSGKLDQLAQQREGSWPNTFRVGSTIPAADYIQAMRIRTKLQAEMALALKDVDLYLTVPLGGPSIAYTNLCGHPTVVTRCGMLNGLPQMIEFTGQLYREDAILRTALAFEQATSWHKEWPDTEKIPLESAPA